MSTFCSDCGTKYKAADKFCTKCGNQKVTINDLALLSDSTRPIFVVLVMQILLFFIYPIIYLRNLQLKLKTHHKFVNFSYNLWYICLISGLSALYVKYLWVLIDSSPSEKDVFFGFSTLLFLLPYVLWWIFYGFTYILSIIFSVRRMNELLPVKYRINTIIALILGIFYIQLKINSAVGTNKKHSKLMSREGINYNQVLRIGIIGCVVLIFTVPGQIVWSHINAMSSSFSSEMNDATMDIQAQLILIDSSPNRTTMDNVAKICENNTDTILSLGCNIQVGDKFNIYISKVNEPSLSGIEVYSTSHEMLHTVYAKLAPNEKIEIDKSLLEIYPKIMSSDDLITINVIKPYLSENKETLVNELHSIVPLFKGDLGTVLDQHYNKYFKDRKQLSKVYKKSEQVLLDAENKVKDFETSIDKFENNLKIGAETIARQEADLNYYARAGNVYSYNSILKTYNSNIDLYNSNYDKYKVEYENYKKVYSYYTNLYASLRRNVTYQEAALITSNAYTKAQ